MKNNSSRNNPAGLSAFPRRWGALPGSQRGLALILVMFVFAIVTILATGMLNRAKIDVARTANLVNHAQAFQYAVGAEALAGEVLSDDLASDAEADAFVDHLEEPWQKYGAVYPVEHGTISAQIDDLQGKFNLNSLLDPSGSVNADALKRFERLLDVLGIKQDFSLKILDWLDADNEVSDLGGAEEEDYLVAEQPYRTANGYMSSKSELLLIDGMDIETYDLLAPFVVALPDYANRINVNTAPTDILMTLSDKVTRPMAESIVRDQETGYESVAEFLEQEVFSGLGISGEGLAVNSHYFQATVNAVFLDREARLVSMLHRDNDGRVRVLKRDFSKKYQITKPIVNF